MRLATPLIDAMAPLVLRAWILALASASRAALTAVGRDRRSNRGEETPCGEEIAEVVGVLGVVSEGGVAAALENGRLEDRGGWDGE
jgi:hypothetical protein